MTTTHKFPPQEVADPSYEDADEDKETAVKATGLEPEKEDEAGRGGRGEDGRGRTAGDNYTPSSTARWVDAAIFFTFLCS